MVTGRVAETLTTYGPPLPSNGSNTSVPVDVPSGRWARARELVSVLD